MQHQRSSVVFNTSGIKDYLKITKRLLSRYVDSDSILSIMTHTHTESFNDGIVLSNKMLKYELFFFLINFHFTSLLTAYLTAS